MKALSFLGKGRYETITYVWKDGEGRRSWETHLFPEAVARIFEPKELLVFVTEEAMNYRPPRGEKCPTCNQVLPEPKEEKTHLETLRERLRIVVRPIQIPEGRSEGELWEIFDRVASKVDEGDTILLDITHAFRSIPLVVFGVAAYLRRTKKVKIERIIYGAFEARDQANHVPIFDLTLLLDLLDWLGGAEFFLRRSDATLLGEQLQSIHQQAWRSGLREDLPRRLQNIGNQLTSFSQAMHLARPREVMLNAHRLQKMLGEAASEFERWAKPFSVILNQIRPEAERFAHDEPDRLDRENLQRQLALIQHFVEKGLWMQAITLAREWVVTWVAFQRGEGDWLERSYREEIEEALGAAKQRLQKKNATVPAWFDRITQSEEVAKLWDWLTQLRNDVAHCGMRKDAAGISNIETRAKEIPQRLKALMNGLPDRVLYGSRVVIDLKSLYREVAKLDELPHYLEQAKELAGEGNEVVLTGQAPIWLYLAVAHALHGKARRLYYSSPVTGEVLIFDHSPR